MYINLFIICILFINSCSDPETSSSLEYKKYSDGNIRDFDIMSDTLFVASESNGLLIYKVNHLNESFNLDLLYPLVNQNKIIETPVTLEIAEKSRSLVILDDYNHTYISKLDFFGTNSIFSSIACDDYQRKSAIIEYDDNTVNLITPFRHKATQNEVDLLAWNTSFLHRITFKPEEYAYNVYSGLCSDTLYKYLNYDIKDVFYKDQKLYLVNPDSEANSIHVLSHNLIDSTFSYIDTLDFESTPTIITSYGDSLFIGMDNKAGCYIQLLGNNDTNNSNFNIASGYSIKDIQVYDDYIVLSAGYDGVLVYDRDTSGLKLSFVIKGIYAYKALLYDDLNLMVGTKNGLHVYKLER